VQRTFEGLPGQVWSLAFSRDGKRLAAGCFQGSVFIWDLSTGQRLHDLRIGDLTVPQLAFSPDSQKLAVAGQAAAIRLYDVTSGREERPPLYLHQGRTRCVAFNPNNTLMATGGEDCMVPLLEVATCQVPYAFHVPTEIIHLAFSPDGHELAAISGGTETTVRLWNVESKQERLLRGHTAAVSGVAFHPDGHVLATSSEDGTVRLWQTAEEKNDAQVLPRRLFGGPVRGVAFTPEGRYLVTANDNGTLTVVRLAKPGEVFAMKGLFKGNQ
jgi:WD40 repeat protein